jgi:hypothetical protein
VLVVKLFVLFSATIGSGTRPETCLLDGGLVGLQLAALCAALRKRRYELRFPLR